MRTIFSASFLATAVAVSLLAGPGWAQQQESGVMVRGEGRVEAAPDMATLTLGVTAEAGTSREAMARNADAMSAVLGRLRSSGIDERDVQTSGLTLSPQYGRAQESEAPQVSGYVAQNVVTVRVRDLAALGDVLDASVDAGANTLGRLSFGVAEPEALEAEARRLAVEDAMGKARELTAAADTGLGPVRAIFDEGGGGRPVEMMEARMAAADSIPVAEGVVAVESNVRMIFEIVE